MYSFITTSNSLQIRGILKEQAISEVAATLNEEFRSQQIITIDLRTLNTLTLSTVMKLITLQSNYKNCGKQILFLGLENDSVRGTFGLAGKRQLLNAAA